ncbi:hypothetical protein RHOSPDRAFT_17004 [Rhodotorula sp. JG-1b]|nr:hypothetical protein RHOSPDRAFT_17004 [Rhodotorula sp. JG-1b]
MIARPKSCWRSRCVSIGRHSPSLTNLTSSPQAIYPDLVSWVELPDGQGVEVKITAPVVFEEPRELEVVDWPASATKLQTSEETSLVEAVATLSLEKKADASSSPSHSRPRRGKTARKGGGGGGGEGKQAPLDKVVSLAATAEVFQPRYAAQKPVPPNGTRQFARATTTGEKQASADVTRGSRVRVIPAQDPRPPPTDVAQQRASLKGAPGGEESLAPPQPCRLSLRHLPSIQLSLRLPTGYPDTEPPTCITISDADRWLGSERRRAAERKLAELSAQFATSSHSCPLCFTTQRGSSCIRIASCGCVFCIACLKDYFSLLITEGLVRSVACPSRGCVESRAHWEKDEGASKRLPDPDRDGTKPGRVTASEVEELVGEEGRKRWEWLQEKARVESDPSITWCPREACQAPVPKLSEDEEKLRVCPACDYSFCVFCRRGWHGTRNACALPQSSAIVSGYLSGDAEQRQTLEVRYGAANIKRLVAAYEEERALQEWLQAHSTQCPGCSAWVEKSQGCNHMTCAKCASHFCYRCGKSISPRDPYKHFSTPGMTCYGKLFDFAPGQEPEPEQWVNFMAEDAY